MRKTLNFFRQHSLLIESLLIILLTISIFFKIPSEQKLTDLYPFISPRVLSSSVNDIIINLVPLRRSLTDFVSSQKGTAEIYFEYLPSGTSIGINEKNQHRIASLVKVPNTMVIYKKIDRGEITLDQEVTLRKEFLDDKFGNLWKMGEGAKITVREALNASLMQSDNTANNVLLSLVSDQELDDIFQALDIPVEGYNDVFLISSKNYSSIFRSLYLSSYLPFKYSNEILSILTQTDYTDKIPAGVGPGVKVAHKIGVFTKSEPDNEDIFSDCGIVYLPKRPYSLCVMVPNNEKEATKIISGISKIIFDYMSETTK